MDDSDKPKPVATVGQAQLQIQLDEDVAQGIYSNLVMINHNQNEFTLDFIYVQPQQPKAKVRARIIATPRHTKRVLAALSENLKKYEAKFGEIDLSNTSGEPVIH
jgi:hypothetical protein